MKIQSFLFALAAFALGLYIGWLDLHAKEAQGPVLLLLFSGAALGAAVPRGAWRWALALGLGIPGMHIIGGLLGVHPSYPVEPGVYATLLALIPAFIGTYSGVGLRYVMSSSSRDYNRKR